MKSILSVIILLIWCAASPMSYANDDVTITVSDPHLTSYLEQQRNYLKDKVSTAGSWLNGNKTDLNNLQRLFDEKRLDRNDQRLLQTVGIAMGDQLIKDTYGNFQWSFYTDKYGRSRALCQRGHTPCFFPVTSISRRVQGGLDVEISRVYNLLLEQMNKTPIQ